VTLDPEEHDRRMVAIQVLTHTLNSTFMRVLGQLGFTYYHNLSTPVFRLQNVLAGRVLDGDPGKWGQPPFSTLNRVADRLLLL